MSKNWKWKNCGKKELTLKPQLVCLARYVIYNVCGKKVHSYKDCISSGMLKTPPTILQTRAIEVTEQTE